ncbi:MAG TPA: cation transporter, partial [bacterium]|nr:cation transporter [bacterium]
YSGGRLAYESSHVLLEAVPAGMDFHAVRTAMEGVPGVSEVHDLHIWTLGSGHPVLTAHVTIAPEADHNAVLLQELTLLHEQFDLDHVTLQLEQRHCQGAVCEAPLPRHREAAE